MEVNVWVNNREKKVKGLTKRTTCHDVITALLYNKTKADKLADEYIDSYVLIEQWRECERILPRNTKIIKTWRSWHNEQPNVKFHLRKKIKEFRTANDSCKVTKPKPREIPERVTRKRKSIEKNKRRARSVERSDQHENIKWLNEQNSQRISRSNDELLSGGSNDIAPPINNHPASEGLVELVIGQEEQLHNLIETIKQTDLEIEYYETQMHLCRMYTNGKNYVQESYISAAENSEFSNKILSPSIDYEMSSTDPSINTVGSEGVDSHITDQNCNDIVLSHFEFHEDKTSCDEKLKTTPIVTNGTCFLKAKKHVTFAKHDSLGQRISAESVESLNNIGVERKHGYSAKENTIYETDHVIRKENENSLHADLSYLTNDQPFIRTNSERRTNSNNNLKSILVVKNNHKHDRMTHQQTSWDQNSIDTDSSSDTGLSSMQDSEDGGTVHTISVTLV